MKKIIIFGAGKIGRSFIGQLFNMSGYEVVFIDKNEKLINDLNREKSYKIIIKGKKEDDILVDNIRGVILSDHQKVFDEMVDTDLWAISVGFIYLPDLLPVIAGGLSKRYEIKPQNPVDIIVAENLRNSADYVYESLMEHLPAEFPFKAYIGIIETSIGKMVPTMTEEDLKKDPLLLFAEPYNTLILDKKSFKNPLPKVKGLDYKSNIKAWVDRKSFLHNLGHAVTAYVGYINNPEFKFIYEVLKEPDLKEIVRDTMIQSATAVQKHYPREFTLKELIRHVDDLLARFSNVHLKDTIYRVGYDLQRKLSGDDRLAGAIKLAIEHDLPYDQMLYALVCGIYFRGRDENGDVFRPDVQFFHEYGTDLEKILIKVAGFSPAEHQDVFRQALLFQKNIDSMLRLREMKIT
ncbi:MAG: NAD-binding protein [Bacteroidales bacterium]